MAVRPDVIGAGIVSETVETLHDIDWRAIAVGHGQGHDHAAVIANARLHPMRIGQGVQIGGAAIIRGHAPMLSFDGGLNGQGADAGNQQGDKG